MPSLLEVRNLAIEFPARDRGGTRWLPAVRDFTFSIAPGEVLGLVGESGSGKSVTSLAIMRLLPPQARVSGAMWFDGHDLLRASDHDMRALRGARMAMIFQEPMTALNPVMRIGDQVAEAVLAHNGRRSPLVSRWPMAEGRRPYHGPERRANNGHITRSLAWKLTLEALTNVGIPDPERRARDYPHQLSGGQRQRAMIAMAIVNHPQLLIADEPTTALDVTIQAQILELLAELRSKFGLAMMFISHDLAVVSQVSDRVGVMYAGSMVEMGPAREVFRNPAHPYTRGLLHSAPTLRTDRGRPLVTIEGTVPAIAAIPPGCTFEPRCDLRIPACAQALPPLIEINRGHWARCPVVNSVSSPR
jgi:oligopeptide/dipeptide ABC transporter ATP-binding protein